MKKYSFDNSAWMEDFVYVYSPIVKSYPTFKQGDDYLVNRFDHGINDYEYISILSKDLYTKAKITVECDFDKYGAPLVVFSNDIKEGVGKDSKKHLFYGSHFEVVAWEEGCNVWYLTPDSENSEHPVKPTLLLGAKFPVGRGEPIKLSVEIVGGKINIDVNGNSYCVKHDMIPNAFYMGYTACEGINKLYSVQIEDI